MRDDFAKVDEVIRDSAGVAYPMTLIIKKKNPHRSQVFEAFMQATLGYNMDK